MVHSNGLGNYVQDESCMPVHTLCRVSYRGRGTPGFPPPDNSPTYDVIKSLVRCKVVFTGESSKHQQMPTKIYQNAPQSTVFSNFPRGGCPRIPLRCADRNLPTFWSAGFPPPSKKSCMKPCYNYWYGRIPSFCNNNGVHGWTN